MAAFPPARTWTCSEFLKWSSRPCTLFYVVRCLFSFVNVIFAETTDPHKQINMRNRETSRTRQVQMHAWLGTFKWLWAQGVFAAVHHVLPRDVAFADTPSLASAQRRSSTNRNTIAAEFDSRFALLLAWGPPRPLAAAPARTAISLVGSVSVGPSLWSRSYFHGVFCFSIR